MERRGHLAGGLSARLQHVRSQLAGEHMPGSRCSLAGARWWWRSATRFSSGHAAPGRLWCIATIGLHLGMALFMGLVFFSSVMILLTGCLFLIPEMIPEDIQAQPVAPGQRAAPGGAPRGQLPCASRARGQRRIGALRRFRAPRPPSHGTRPDSGRGRGSRRAGTPRLRPRLRLPRCRQSPTGHARHALRSRVLLEGVHGDGDRSACGRGKNRARRSRTHVPSRFFPRRPGGVGDLDDAGSSHPPQRITPA